MSRISCNVTKDLLPSYLDEICSEESKELVEEHLEECASCKAFLEQLQEQDLGKDAPKTDYLKKVSHFVERRVLVGTFATMLLLTVIFFVINSNGRGVPLWFLTVEMPVLMLIYAYVLMSTQNIVPMTAFDSADSVGKERSIRKAECVILLLEALCVVVAIGIQFLTVYWIKDDSFRPCPLYELGPHLSRGAFLLGGIAILLLWILYLNVRGKRVYSLVCQNMALLVIHLMVSFDDMLHRMVDPEMLFWICVRSIAILVLEFVLVTVVLYFATCGKKSANKKTENFFDGKVSVTLPEKL